MHVEECRDDGHMVWQKKLKRITILKIVFSRDDRTGKPGEQNTFHFDKNNWLYKTKGKKG